ncbi:hypothetical protein CSUI_009750, partial [Cystoisospora suis]
FTDQILLGTSPRYSLAACQPDSLLSEVALYLSSLHYPHEGFCRLSLFLLHRWQLAHELHFPSTKDLKEKSQEEGEEEKNTRRRRRDSSHLSLGEDIHPQQPLAYQERGEKSDLFMEKERNETTEECEGSYRDRKEKQEAAEREVKKIDRRRVQDAKRKDELYRQEEDEGDGERKFPFCLSPSASLHIQIRLIYGLVGLVPITQQVMDLVRTCLRQTVAEIERAGMEEREVSLSDEDFCLLYEIYIS